MVKAKHVTIEEILSPVNDKKKAIVDKLRNLVKDTVPKAQEKVRDQRLTYSFSGKDFAAIRIAQGHVDLAFLVDRSLSSSCLKGQGIAEDPVHMELTNLKNFDEQEAKRLLKQAIETLTTVGVKEEPRQR